MRSGKRGFGGIITKLFRLNADIAIFLASSLVVLALLAAWDLSYFGTAAAIFRISSCLIVFSFSSNAAAFQSDNPSIRFLAPSFVFIALFESVFALLQTDTRRPVGDLAVMIGLSALWFQAFACFFLSSAKERSSRINATWAVYGSVTAALAGIAAAGILPIPRTSPAFPAFLAANLIGLEALFVAAARRVKRSFPSGRYQRRIRASCVFCCLSLPLLSAGIASDASIGPAAGAVLRFSGEFLRMVAIFLVQKAVVSQSIVRPYRNMFRDMGMERVELRSANRELAMKLEEKELLLREVHHRVKNNLQIIASLLDLASRDNRELAVKEALQVSKDRVQSVALLHDLLYRSGQAAAVDLEAFVGRLVASAHAAAAGSIALEDAAPRISLPLERALPLGLALNELLTNALKYGAASGAEPDILVRLAAAEGPSGEPFVRVEVRDGGPGLPPDFDPGSSEGLGLTLVRSLAAQLNGEASWSPRADGRSGLVASLSFPSVEA